MSKITSLIISPMAGDYKLDIRWIDCCFSRRQLINYRCVFIRSWLAFIASVAKLPLDFGISPKPVSF